MPIPPPINSHAPRCRGAALASRGNQARGTDTIRPSLTITKRASFEHDTSTASNSALSAKVIIPFLQKVLSFLQNDLAEFGQFVSAKSARVRQGDRFEPKLGIPSGVGDVNMRRLASFQAEEEKPISPNPQNGWHVRRI